MNAADEHRLQRDASTPTRADGPLRPLGWLANDVRRSPAAGLAHGAVVLLGSLLPAIKAHPWIRAAAVPGFLRFGRKAAAPVAGRATIG